MIFNNATAEQITNILNKMSNLASQEEVNELKANTLKAETLTTSLFSITADTQADFFVEVGKLAVSKGIKLYETLYLSGVWQKHFYATVFCTRQTENTISMLYWDNGGFVWVANYNKSTEALNNHYNLANTNQIAALQNRVTALEQALPYKITINDSDKTIDFADR